MLWRDLRALQIYGANTDVGKTIISTVLCKALQGRASNGGLLYLKPVSTGPANDADDRHVARFVPGAVSKCISQFSEPVSPHVASRTGGSDIARSDASITTKVKDLLSGHANSGGRYAVLETAGGVLSPAPSGSTQADLYRPLRLPALLVGDSKLGGIGITISAFESLYIRGYDVQGVFLFSDSKWGNYDYLREHFRKHDLATFSLPLPPAKRENPRDDGLSMEEYYETSSTTPAVAEFLDLFHQKHFSRISKISSMPAQTDSILWHPFRQHQIPHKIIAIDSAYGDNFEAYTGDADYESHNQTTKGISSITPDSKSLLTPLFDGSASWWTQGLGHGNPTLALTAAHAAGRYGHVMFAHAVHEPALDLAYNLLSTLANPRLSRVFYSDNGSTGVEVAVKMALRASCTRYNWSPKSDGGGEVGVLGLKGSYHGDTIGAMNASESSVFNEKVDWHKPWGYWFDPPTIKMVRGKYVLDIPDYVGASGETQQVPDFMYDSLEEVFDYGHNLRQKIARTYYREMITATLKRLVNEESRRFGALIMEPVLMGAGGMIFVDPLFQRTLIQVIRENPDLICPGYAPLAPTSKDPDPNSASKEWLGLPLIADEVFTGLYRLGRASSSSFLSNPSPSATLEHAISPDISVHAKLLTGGLLPLAITTASEPIFSTFLSDSKADALLHGHSYTAHAVGCAVADRSLRELNTLSREEGGGGWEGYREMWRASTPSSALSSSPLTTSNAPFSFFSPTCLSTLSHSPLVESIIAFGTVMAITLKDNTSSNYASNAAASLQSTLLTSLGSDGVGVHSRVLGNVLYLMTSLTTKRKSVEGLEGRLIRALC